MTVSAELLPDGLRNRRSSSVGVRRRSIRSIFKTSASLAHLAQITPVFGASIGRRLLTLSTPPPDFHQDQSVACHGMGIA
jgi:hypothetical protein